MWARVLQRTLLGRGAVIAVVSVVSGAVLAGSPDYDSLLLKAARRGDVDIAITALREGASPYAEDRKHRSALSIAEGRGHDDVASAIIAAIYQRAANTDTIEAYDLFIRRYPDSEPATQASAAIDRIRWDETVGIGTIEAYRQYAEANPNSAYRDLAEQEIERSCPGTPPKPAEVSLDFRILRVSLSNDEHRIDDGRYIRSLEPKSGEVFLQLAIYLENPSKCWNAELRPQDITFEGVPGLDDEAQLYSQAAGMFFSSIDGSAFRTWEKPSLDFELATEEKARLTLLLTSREDRIAELTKGFVTFRGQQYPLLGQHFQSE